MSDDPTLPGAAAAGQMQIVQNLLDEGADVNQQAFFGKTALMFAAEKGHTGVAGLLLQQEHCEEGFGREGAQIDLGDANGQTALMWAAMNNQKDTAEFLLQKGAQINLQDKYGMTPLINAVAYAGHKETFELLLQKGAQIHLQDTDGHTALQHAEGGNHTEIVGMVLKMQNEAAS